jgi:small-conductance mechanosensitive channel
MEFLDNYTSNEYAQFLIIFISTVIIIFLSYFIIKKIVRKIAGRKKSYATFIFKQLSVPILAFIFFTGLYTSLKTISILEKYSLTVDNIFFVIIVFIVALFISRFITVLMIGWLKVRKGFERTPGLINKAITVIIFIIAIIVILGYFKVDVTPMVAGVGLGALAIGLALQSTLSNFFAGVHLLSDRPIDVGDYIELDENTKGVVEDIGWRSTRIKTLTENLLIIPNAKLADSNILNFSKPKQDLTIWVHCGVAYESDLKKVEKVTLEVAKEIQQKIPGAIKEFEPGFRYREFGDSNIKFIAILGIEEPLKRFVVKNEFIKALKERFNKENIEISWPIRKVYNMLPININKK